MFFPSLPSFSLKLHHQIRPNLPATPIPSTALTWLAFDPACHICQAWLEEGVPPCLLPTLPQTGSKGEREAVGMGVRGERRARLIFRPPAGCSARLLAPPGGGICQAEAQPLSIHRPYIATTHTLLCHHHHVLSFSTDSVQVHSFLLFLIQIIPNTT